MAGRARGVRNSHLFTQVDARRLRSYAAWLGTRGYAASTVARRLASLRSFFRYQRRQGAVAVDPADDIHATGAYRKALIGVMVERALRAAAA